MDKPSVWRQVQQQQSNGGGGGGGGGNAVVVAAGATTAAAPCRPTGARWTPTQDQVKILKELYYGCGIRSPNAEQIQRIAARLRQFGRIEGKNVFYWFQNHKARERHKKRLAIDASSACAGAAADASHLGVVLSPSPGSGATASSGGFYGACNGRGGSAMQMDGSTTTTCWGDSAAANGRGGSAMQMDGSTTTTCWGDSAAAMGATERSFVQLQDYMGVMRSTGEGTHGAAAPTPWPACFPFSADQMTLPPPPTTREPETLPLFPTGGQHGSEGHQGGVNVVHGSSYLQSNFHWWGAAPATTTTTTATPMTFQQQHHHQLQEQHSFYSSNQLMNAGSASLELTLSYPAGGSM